MLTKIRYFRNYIFSPSINVVLIAEITGCKNILTLKRAIEIVSSEFEVLNCKVLQDNEGDFYFAPKDEIVLPYIELRPFIQDSQDFINEQERIPFNIENGDLIRYIISFTDNKLVLSIVSHHIWGDGKYNLVLLDAIMKKLRKLEEQDEAAVEKNMYPIQVFTDEYLSKLVELKVYRAKQYDVQKNQVRKKEAIDMSKVKEQFQVYWKKNRTKVATVVIYEDVVNEFIRQCKKHNITVNNAITTVLAKCLTENVNICIAVNMRTEEKKALGNFSTAVMISSFYDYELSFWDNASKIQHIVNAQVKNKVKLYENFLSLQTKDNTSLLEDYAKLVIQRDEIIQCKPKPMIISNVGKENLEESYGSLSIEKIAFFSPISPQFDSNLGIITHNGKMTLSLQYISDTIDYQKVLNGVVDCIQNFVK